MTRITTAIEASRYAYPDGSSTVILAAATSPTDALVAAGLSQAPVLLVPSCGALPEVVAAEIGRLAPEQIITLGGSAAVRPDVIAQAVEGQSIPSVA